MVQKYLDELVSVRARFAFAIIKAPQAQSEKPEVPQHDGRECDLCVVAFT